MTARLAYSSAAASAIKATVVFIAPTQSGKSKTIEELHLIQGNPSPSAKGYLKVGNGKQSQTTEPKLLPAIPISYLKVNTWEPPDAGLRSKIADMKSRRADGTQVGQTLLPEESEALCEYRTAWKCDKDWKADIQVNVANPVTILLDSGLRRVHLQCLDTPGLDDTFGRDDEHMERILEVLGSPAVESVNAFVFVVKNGQPFSDRFLKSVRRYWDQFPSFRHNWIFVHTAMDPSKTDYKQGWCFEQEVEERKQLLIENLQRTCSDKAQILPNLPHVFVDNVIPAERQVDKDPALQFGLEMKKAVRAEAYNSLLLTISSNRPVESCDLHYQKSEDMVRIDDILIGQCRAYREGLLETLATVEHQHTQLMGKYTETVQEISELKGKRQVLEAEANKLNSKDVLVDKERNPERPWRLFGNSEVITIVSKFEIAHREITCATEFAYSQVEDCGVESVGNGTFVWTVKISSPPFRGCKAIMKTYVEKRVKFAAEIKCIERKLDKLGILLRAAETKRKGLDSEIASAKKEVDTLTKRIGFVTTSEADLATKELKLPRYVKLKDFYRNANGSDRALLKKYFDANGCLDSFLGSKQKWQLTPDEKHV